MKKSKLMAALIALLMSASILPMQAWAEEENTSEEAAPAEEVIEAVEAAPAEMIIEAVEAAPAEVVIEAVEPAPVEEIVEVAEPADAEAEAEVALAAEPEAEAAPEAQETEKQTEVSEPAASVEEPASADAETEESEEPAAEPFTCKVGVTPLNREAIREGDKVVLMATVTDASMAYTLRWESRAITAAPDDPWHLEGTDESIAFTATEATAAREYRVSAVGEDGTAQISKTWRFALAEPEMSAESVEEPAEEPAESTEEAVEEPAEVTEEIIEEIIPEEETLEIDDYETPLGLGMSIVLENTGDAEAAPVDVREGADGMSAIFTSLPEGAEITVIAVEGDWALVEVDGQTGYIYSADLARYTEIAEDEQTGKKVTIFSSRRSVMHDGETVQLSSVLEGFEDCEEVTYQWYCDTGSGYRPVEGATSPVWSFVVDAESLEWGWQLEVSFS